MLSLPLSHGPWGWGYPPAPQRKLLCRPVMVFSFPSSSALRAGLFLTMLCGFKPRLEKTNYREKGGATKGSLSRWTREFLADGPSPSEPSLGLGSPGGSGEKLA